MPINLLGNPLESRALKTLEVVSVHSMPRMTCTRNKGLTDTCSSEHIATPRERMEEHVPNWMCCRFCILPVSRVAKTEDIIPSQKELAAVIKKIEFFQLLQRYALTYAL
jgi:hypothetical protein